MEMEAAANPPGVRVETVSFADVPSQSALFLEFLKSDSVYSNKFWPNKDVPLPDFAGNALKNYKTDRNLLCDALLEENKNYGAPEPTLDNIAKLRESDCVAVITGQQAGLFSGPAYTFYKALTAIRIAENLREQGVNAVPVFWIATEDHDFEEISVCGIRDSLGKFQKLKISVEESEIGRPVGDIPLPAGINDVIGNLNGKAGQTHFSDEVTALLKDSYPEGVSIGTAFGKLQTSLLGKFGLIFVNPQNPAVRELSAPIVAGAIERSGLLRDAIKAKNRELDDAGFHRQVRIEDGFIPLFVITKDGKRRALVENESSGQIESKDGSAGFSKDELIRLTETAPRMFSPNALLRPVVQDFVFPTACYVGGAAEISYFAQNSAIYRVLGRPVTPIRHRNSFTILEPRQGRTLARYGIKPRDLFDGPESMMHRLAGLDADAETISLFGEMENGFEADLDRLEAKLRQKDPGLADSAQKRKRKILWHIAALKQKFLKAESLRDSDRVRRIGDLFETARPDGVLQERALSFLDFVYRHGPGVTDWVYNSVSDEGNEHKFLFL